MVRSIPSIHSKVGPLLVVLTLLGILFLSMLAVAQAQPAATLVAANDSLPIGGLHLAPNAPSLAKPQAALKTDALAAAVLLEAPPPTPDGSLTISGTQVFTAPRTTSTVSTPMGSDAITVTNALSFTTGDEILIMDMAGDDVGTWETAIVSDVVGNALILSGTLQNGYDGTIDKIMVQQVPYYTGVLVKAGGKLTTDAWDGETGGVIFFRAVTVTVESGGSIDVSGLGYRKDEGPGVGTVGGDGGSHGGWGGGGHASPYGSVFEPTTMGSGGRSRQSVGGRGGGAIYLVVSNSLQLDPGGVIAAAGASSAPNNSGSGGGGAGGSIWLETPLLTGTGTINVGGGDAGGHWQGEDGGGAGGRVAVYTSANGYGEEISIQAYAGGGIYGGAGTIYRYEHGQSPGTDVSRLYVDNADHDGLSAGLLPGKYHFDTITLTNRGHLTVMSSTSQLTLTNGALTGDGTGRLVGEGILVGPPSFSISSATLVVLGDLVGSQNITCAVSGGLELYAHTPWHAGVYTFTTIYVGDQGRLSLFSYDNENTVYTDDLGLELRVENLVVDEGGWISGDDSGYGSASGPGAGISSGAWTKGGGGGGYGDRGGAGDDGAAGGMSYGSAHQPSNLGSGGGKGNGVLGGAGGGAIRLIVSDTFAVSGTLSTDGANGVVGGSNNTDSSGAGAGGSIWIDTGTFRGGIGGNVRANGGNGQLSAGAHSFGGGGAGGRIAIDVETDMFAGQMEVAGGTGYERGMYGTVYLGYVDPLTSTLVAAPVSGLVADGEDTSTISVTVRNRAGTPIVGEEVHLEVWEGTGNYINDVLVADYTPVSIGTTDASGVVTATLASTQAETKTVLAWTGPLSQAVRLVPTATVTFGGADLVVGKTGPQMVFAGSAITYTITIANQGDRVATDSVLTDTLPPGLDFVSQSSAYTFAQAGRILTWQLGNLDSSFGDSFDLVVTTALTIPHGSGVTNRLEATTTAPEPDLTDNLVEVTTAAHQRQPDLAIDPAYSALFVQRGDTVTLTLQVHNTGTAMVSGAVASPPAHLAWASVEPETLPDLAPDESTTLIVTLTPPADLDVGSYRDLVQVQAPETDSCESALAVRVFDVSQTLVLTVSNVSGLVKGADVHLVRKEESVLVTDGVTKKPVHQEARAETDDAGVAILTGLEGGVYTYTVTTADDGGAWGTVTITSGEEPLALAVELTGSALLVPEPLYPEIHVRPGETGFFEAVVRNTGLTTATHVLVTPPAGAGWIYVGVIGPVDELAPGEALSVTLFASPPAALTPPHIEKRYVQVSADGLPPTRFALTVNVSDGQTGTTQFLVTDPAGTPLKGAAVTLVSKQVTTETVELVGGQAYTYTYYQNFGGQTDAGGVVSFEDIPAGSYNYFAGAAGYRSASEDPVVDPDGTSLLNVTLDPLPFSAEWSVVETEIEDTYSATLHLTFEVGRLQVQPFAVIVDDCDGGSWSGSIHVRNPLSVTVTNVSVQVTAPDATFTILSGPSELGPYSEGEFQVSAVVQSHANSWGEVTVSGNGVLDGWAPVRVVARCVEDCEWNCSWGGCQYIGPYPYFPGPGAPPQHEGDAIVQMRLSQTMMLERQAFLATLSLNNGVLALDDLKVYITAENDAGESRPNDFTIAPAVPTGFGAQPPGSAIEQQWVIVPADLDITEPTLYTLQATLAYTIANVFHELPLVPAVILVQPQPEVHISYFVPGFVRADEPFLLGVVAENRGAGTARNLRIQTTQPEIYDQAEEPVSFHLEGTFEGGAVHAGDLLLNFGDVPAGESLVGGWMMVSSHHGRFLDLTARCEHLNYQGMALSNLIWCDGSPNSFLNDLEDLNTNNCPDGGSTCDMQGCAGGPINTRSGNYSYQTTDLSISTLGGSLWLERSYNSSQVTTTTRVVSETSPMSPGWTHRYAMRLEFPDPAGGPYFTTVITDPQYQWLNLTTAYYRPTVRVRLPGGSLLRFADNGDGTYTTYPGAQTTLSRQEAGGVLTYTLTASDQTVRIFDQYGRLHTIRDRHGNETHLTYSGERLTRVTGPLGQRWLDFDYDQDGRLERVTDHADRYVEYGYDGAGDLVVMTDSLSLTWTYVYTGEHLLYEVYDPLGRLLERTDYDGAGRATYQQNGAGVTLTLVYSPDETTIVEAGQWRQHSYDVFGALTSVADAAEHTQSYVLNSDFRREQAMDAAGNTTRYEYGGDCGCRPTAIVDAQGHRTEMVYDGNNNLVARTDALSRTTWFKYDGQNLLVVTDTLTGTTEYTYNTYGQVTSVTDAEGHPTYYGYDEMGQRTAITDALGTVTTYGYDKLGRLLTTTVAAGTPLARVTVNEYDAADRLVQVTENYLAGQPPGWQDEYNLIITYEYDPAGRLLTTTTAANTPLARISVNDYTVGGQLTQVTENYTTTSQAPGWQDEYNLVTTYEYDPAGRLVTTTVLAGTSLARKTVNDYDELGRLERVTTNYVDGSYNPAHPDQDLITEYEYRCSCMSNWKAGDARVG
jgi:uncharacterized repeat protein (TIGR01451 family)